MKLAGKVAIVTGSSLSIGRAIALGLAAEGASARTGYQGNLAFEFMCHLAAFLYRLRRRLRQRRAIGRQIVYV